MKYRIASRLLVAGRTTYQRGQVVDGADLPSHRIPSLVRLGLITEEADTGAMTKAQLIEKAEAAGLTVPKKATKADIAAMLA